MTIVLIADGDDDIRSTLRLFLEGEGYAIQEAADVETVLRLLRAAAEPAVVLLDHFRAGVGSTHVLEVASNHPSVGRHAFIFMTTTANRLLPELASLVLSLAVPIIGKPFDLDVLLEAVRTAERKLMIRAAVM